MSEQHGPGELDVTLLGVSDCDGTGTASTSKSERGDVQGSICSKSESGDSCSQISVETTDTDMDHKQSIEDDSVSITADIVIKEPHENPKSGQTMAIAGATVDSSDDKSLDNVKGGTTQEENSGSINGSESGNSSKDSIDASPKIKRSDSLSSHLSFLSNTTNLSEGDDSEPPIISLCKTFDVKAIQDVIESTKSEGTEETKISLTKQFVNATNRKKRTAVHEMVIAFVNSDPLQQVQNKSKFIEITSILVQNGLDINAVDLKQKQTALHIVAGYKAFPEIIKPLLVMGAKVNFQDASLDTALHKAVFKGDVENSEALVEGGADPNLKNKNGQTPLHTCAKGRRHHEILTLLLKCGGNPNIDDKGGRTPLHMAAKCGEHELVRELLNHGADVDKLEDSGQTPLHLAARDDITGLVATELLEHGADPNIQDEVFMETPLHKAVKLGMIENIRVLLSDMDGYMTSVKVNVKDILGETPLHKAASCCQDVMVWKYLMRARGGMFLKNEAGQSVVTKVYKAKNYVAQSVLRQYGEIDDIQ